MISTIQRPTTMHHNIATTMTTLGRTKIALGAEISTFFNNENLEDDSSLQANNIASLAEKVQAAVGTMKYSELINKSTIKTTTSMPRTTATTIQQTQAVQQQQQQ
jgi:hypothetical protein